MRLFIAIPLPEDVKQQLQDLQQPIDGVRWQNKAQMHLTLKFLGDTPGEQFQELIPTLEEVEAEPFSITLKEFGYFPKGKYPRVLWAGVEENNTLMELQQKVEKACSVVGFEQENRPFTPHVTIGRVNDGSKNDVMSFINQHKQFEVAGVPVESFVLYESKLHPDGAKHKKAKVIHLQQKK